MRASVWATYGTAAIFPLTARGKVLTDLFQVEVLSEDSSSVAPLKVLLSAMADNCGLSKYNLAVRPHRGRGYFPKDPEQKPLRFTSTLFDLLPARCRAYERVEAKPDLLIVTVDADKDDPDLIYRRMEGIVRRYVPSVPFVFGLAVEEMESWLLCDREAVLTAYPDADKKKLFAYEPDCVCGSWEVLAQVVMGEDAKEIIALGYPAVGRYKAEWSAKIACHLKLERNVSPSLKRFNASFNSVMKRYYPEYLEA
jgi:hypothetical protein